MRFLRQSLAGLFLIGLTLGLLASAGYVVVSAVQDRMAREDAPRPARERIVAARVVAPEPGTVAPVLETFGEVRSRRTLDLRVPMAGRIAHLATDFVEGAQVAEGALLLRLDQADALAARAIAANELARIASEEADARRALELAEMDLAVAEEQAELRLRALERRQSLAARGVGAEAAVEEAELALASARQAVVSRRQSLASAQTRIAQAEAAAERQRIAFDEAERRLRDTELHATFGGVLAGVAVVEGGLVTANERIGQLIDPAALEVSFRLSTAQYLRLLDERGALRPQPVAVALDVLGAEIVATGRLSRVGAAVGEGQTGRIVFAELEAAPGFMPGDFVTVRVSEPPLEGVVELPATAVDAGGGVLAVGEGSRLVAARVEILRRQGNIVVARLPEALVGMEIVAERSPLLGEGIRIRPVRPGQPMGEGVPPPAGPASGAPAGPQAAAPGDPAPARAATLRQAEGEDDIPDSLGRIAISEARRAALIAFVEANDRMPAQARSRLLEDLRAERVPAETVARLEARMGG